MNRIILLGRLIKDVEVRYTDSGKVVAQFTLAVDRPFSAQDGQKEADFIPCVVWGKNAEFIGNSFRKGNRILVEGRLQIRKYTAKDGTEKQIAECILGRFEFVESKAASAIKPAPGSAVSAMDAFGPSVDIPF